MYDFNLSVGDTLPISTTNYLHNITVVSIDSIAVSNQYRKRFRLLNAGVQYLIEGIGSDNGLFENYDHGISMDCASSLSCFGLGDTSYYPYYGNTCNITVGLMEIQNSNSEINIFPNPTIDNITIETPKKSTIEILNIQGQTILRQQLQQGKTDIDISGLAKGVYILRLCDNDRTAVTKIVKE
jgi:hypothetical protein